MTRRVSHQGIVAKSKFVCTSKPSLCKPNISASVFSRLLFLSLSRPNNATLLMHLLSLTTMPQDFNALRRKVCAACFATSTLGPDWPKLASHACSSPVPSSVGVGNPSENRISTTLSGRTSCLAQMVRGRVAAPTMCTVRFQRSPNMSATTRAALMALGGILFSASTMRASGGAANDLFMVTAATIRGARTSDIQCAMFSDRGFSGHRAVILWPACRYMAWLTQRERGPHSGPPTSTLTREDMTQSLGWSVLSGAGPAGGSGHTTSSALALRQSDRTLS
mmetsp:Transcript_11453/g.35905  ORF Transcript_11453/g.35905 Transcript_11453/m.35905 type:complete len:279 (+) Transcript_11453:486-1322(+)